MALGLAGQIGEFRHGGLHAEGHFVLLDAGLDFRIADGGERAAVQFVEAVEHVAAGFARDAGRVLEEKHRIAERAQRDAGVLAWQIAGTPEPGGNRLHVRVRRGVRGVQHDEGRQLLVHRAEAVGQP